MPLCPAHLEQACSPHGLFVQGDGAPCPLCDRDTYGSYVLCGHCAAEAEVCVLDARPVDGSSSAPPAWLAGLGPAREAAWRGATALTPDDVDRIRRARRLHGTWRAVAPRGFAAVQERFLVLEAPHHAGLLASVDHGRLAELSRFRWAYGDGLLTATPLPVVLPPGAWEQPLQLAPTPVEVTATPTGPRRLGFPDRPSALAATGWSFTAAQPDHPLSERLLAVLRAGA